MKVLLFCFINSYMNYLISSFDGNLVSDETFTIVKGVKYEILKPNSLGVIFSKTNGVPFIFDLNNPCDNTLKISYQGKNYYFIFPNNYSSFYSTIINCKTDKIVVNLSSFLCVEINGVLICEKIVDNLQFSHYELDNDLCLIYFTGKRNFIVVIKSGKLLFADFYDECNIIDKEKYFMCKLNDSLNHGRVCSITKGEVEVYLVYLDDEEMKIKDCFLPFVFLDCVKAKNIGYCKNLLCEELNMCDQIEKFFPDFAEFYSLDDNVFALIKKNTLSGIFKFEVSNNQITNIVQI